MRLALLATVPIVLSAWAIAQTPQSQPGAEPVAGAASNGKAQLSSVPDGLDFGEQLVDSASATRSVTLTANPDSRVTVSLSSPIGDFVIGSNNCPGELDPAASCAIGISFAPKRLGKSAGSITIATKMSGTAFGKVVALTGTGVATCLPARSIFSWSDSKSFHLLLTVVVLYVIGLILVRWNMISLPNRELLRAQIDSDKQRVNTLIQVAGQPGPGMAQVMALLNEAEKLIQNTGMRSRLLNYVFWSRGQELAGWGYVHEAERQMVSLLPEARVRASLEGAETDLRQAETPTALALADRVQKELGATPPAPPERLQAQLAEALGFLYDRTDCNFADLIGWHNKAIWLTACGLLLIVSLAAVLGHEVLFLVGATGGLLSRLSRSLYRDEVPTDYGAYWTTLFLSPVVGALAGWFGVVMGVAGYNLNLFGSALRIDWCNPYTPVALGTALALGFSERRFTGILGQLEDKDKSGPKAPTSSQSGGNGKNGPNAPPAPHKQVDILAQAPERDPEEI